MKKGEETMRGGTAPPPAPQTGESMDWSRSGRSMVEMELPVMTAWEDGSGGIRFLGVASSTRIDKQQEKMTPPALESMARAQGIPLLPHHRAAAEEALGIVERGWTDGRSFRVAGRLRGEDPRAWALVKSIQSGKHYGLSVGGRLTKAFWGYAEGTEGPVRHIEEVELEHVALCGPEEAVNPDAELGEVVEVSAEPPPASEPGPGPGGGETGGEVGRETPAEGAGLRAQTPFGRPLQQEGGETVVLARGETAVLARGATPVVPEPEVEAEEAEAEDGAVTEVEAEGRAVEEAEEQESVVPGQRRSLPKEGIGRRDRRDSGRVTAAPPDGRWGVSPRPRGAGGEARESGDRRDACRTGSDDNLWRGVL